MASIPSLKSPDISLLIAWMGCWQWGTNKFLRQETFGYRRHKNAASHTQWYLFDGFAPADLLVFLKDES